MEATKDTHEYVAVKIETKNDVSGNPRRAWLLIDYSGAVVLVAPESRIRGELDALSQATAALSLAGYDRRTDLHNGIVETTFDDDGIAYCEGPYVIAVAHPSARLAVTPGQYRASMRKHDMV